MVQARALQLMQAFGEAGTTVFGFGGAGSATAGLRAGGMSAGELAGVRATYGTDGASTAHPLQGMTPTQVIEQVQQLGVGTGRNELLLWSGLGRGREGIIRSQEYAAQYGGRTLEMTPGC